MAVCQKGSRTETGVRERPDLEGEINIIGNMINNSIGDTDMNARVRIGGLKSARYRLDERICNARWRSKTQCSGNLRQSIRNDVVDRFAYLHTLPRIPNEFAPQLPNS